MKNKILVIEDDRAISELLCMNLEAAGYETVAAYDGEEAQRLLLWQEDADLAVVDIMLPGKDGFALMEDFKKKELPVLYLTAKDDVASKVKGLKLGAEDYMVKPFEMLELLVRIEKVLERTGRAKKVLTVRNILVDIQSHQVYKDGLPVSLKPMEYVVQSAVVEEKDQTEQKKEEKKETVQETVAEQVEAPETYRATIQADLRSADREDKENPMKFTLTADAPVKVPDVDAICLKKVKRVAIPEEEQNKIKDTFGKGQPMQEEKNENEQAGTYTVDGLTYRYSYTQSEQVSDVEELGFQIAKFSFDDCGDMTLASSEKKEREERFQNYIKAGSGKVSKKEAKDKVTSLISGDWEIFESSSKELTEGSTTLEKDDFIFERMIDGVPVNYVRETSLPVNEQALEWENEDGTLHEGQPEGWENEVLTMDFCSGTLQSFLHRNPIEASDASDERLFLLPFDEVKDIFEKTITLQVMTEDKNRLISVDGGSHYRYPSIDAQSAEITITKVQLGYMCMPDSEGSDTEAVLIPVWDFYGTWTSKEPEYEYGNGEDGPVMGDVTMDDAGVPLFTIDARDGSVIQRIQAGWAASMGSKDIK